MMTEVSALLQQGITAAKQGNQAKAREILMRVVELDDRNEMAWLWLSGVVDEISDRIVCLENVLTINPGNAAAERGLRLLQAQLPPEPPPAQAESEGALSEQFGEDWPPENLDNQKPAAGWAAEQPLLEKGSPLSDQGDSKTCVHCGTINPGWRSLCAICGKQVDGGLQQEEIESIGLATEGHPPLPSQSGSEPEPFIESVQLLDDLDTRPQGLITLGAAWIAAIAFNKRGAYEYEIFSASAGRSVTGIVVGGVAIPLIVIILTGLLFATSNASNLLVLATSLATSSVALVCSGLSIAVGIVISFYLWAAGLYLIAWILGGKASFVIHAQLLSVAFSASSLLSTTLAIIGGAVLVALEELTPGGSGSSTVPYLMLLLSAMGVLYSLAMNGQAVSVAHRFSWWGGATVVVLSGLLYSLLAVLLVLILMSISGQSFADLQSLFSTTPTP